MYRWSLVHRTASVAVLIGLFILFQVHAFCPVIRFSYQPANNAVFLFVFLFPWVALRYSFALGRWWKSLITTALVLPFVLYSLIGATICFLFSDVDRLIALVPMNGYRVRVTDSNGGTLGGEPSLSARKNPSHRAYCLSATSIAFSTPTTPPVRWWRLTLFASRQPPIVPDPTTYIARVVRTSEPTISSGFSTSDRASVGATAVCTF